MLCSERCAGRACHRIKEDCVSMHSDQIVYLWTVMTSVLYGLFLARSICNSCIPVVLVPGTCSTCSTAPSLADLDVQTPAEETQETLLPGTRYGYRTYLIALHGTVQCHLYSDITYVQYQKRACPIGSSHGVNCGRFLRTR